MQKSILQVPLDTQLKTNAAKAATEQGFSSLQEIVRVFLTQLASNKVEISLQNSSFLSTKNEKKYNTMTSDFESDNHVHSATNISDLLTKLDED